LFKKEGHYFAIHIRDGRVFYSDQKVRKFFKEELRLLPPLSAAEAREKNERCVRLWGNTPYPDLAAMLQVEPDELEAYNRCESEDDIRRVVLDDCAREGPLHFATRRPLGLNGRNGRRGLLLRGTRTKTLTPLRRQHIELLGRWCGTKCGLRAIS